MKTHYNIHETKSLSNILFIYHKLFMWKMQEGDDLLDHTNNVNAHAEQLVCFGEPHEQQRCCHDFA
jgi:hypothetical protein